MFSINDFDKKFEARRKKIKMFFITSFTLIILGIIVQIAFVYWGYNTIQNNGGVQKTLTDIVRTVKQIDKDSDLKQ
jgi:ABC-type transporter Mla maintaining outer membrane lipid asymmetry permease subunit MlaE